MGTISGTELPTSTCGTAAELHARIGELVATAQASDPLAPVTLVVDSAYAGTVMRRQLVASGVLGTGVANLRLTTVSELITDLARRLGVAGSATLPRMVSEAVVSSVLAADPGPFDRIHEHPSTAVRLADAVEELAWCDLGADALAAAEPVASSTTTSVLAFVGTVREVQRTAYGVRPLADVARDVTVALGTTTGRASTLGRVVVVAQSVPDPAARMLAALDDVHLLSLAADDLPLPERVLECPDPGTEVSLAVRLAVEAIAEGMPPDQVALLYGSANPYTALLASELDAAGLTWHGPAAGSLASTALARAVGALLSMAVGRGGAATGITRPLLLRWINAAPVLDGSTSRPTWRWRRVIRDNNLYADSAGWLPALDAIVRAAEATAEDAGLDPDTAAKKAAKAERAAEAAASLLAGLDDLGSGLDSVLDAATWQELGIALWDLVERFHLGGAWWQAHATERQARERLWAMLLDELPGLDGVDSGAGSADAADRVEWLGQLVDRDLLSRRGRVGDMGVGLHVGPVTGAGTLRFSRVIVVGAAEGLLPALVTEDPLLPDAVRLSLRAARADLPTTTDRIGQVRSAYSAVVGAADSVVATLPRAGVPGHGSVAVSRFLHEAPRGLIERVPSRQATLRLPSGSSVLPLPVTANDLAVLAALRVGDPTGDLAPAREAAISGASAGFDRFHGNLEGIADIGEVWQIDGRDLSASAIEAYLHCPYHFFVQRILGVGTDEIVDEIDEAGAADVGTLVHAALEQFVSDAKGDGLLPGPGETWPDGSVERLQVVWDDLVAEAHARGLLGWAPAWARRQRTIVESFDSFFDADDHHVRFDPALAPEATELRFGFEGDPRVEVTLADGSVVGLRGAIDRFDVSADGTAVGVVDYKTGRSKKFKDMLGIQRPKGGVSRREKVQDLVYDAAARVLAPNATEIKVSFVFVPDGGEVTAVVANHEADRPAALLERLEELADAGRRGRFAPLPAGTHDYCPVCKAMGRQGTRAAQAAGLDGDDEAEVEGGESDD